MGERGEILTPCQDEELIMVAIESIRIHSQHRNGTFQPIRLGEEIDHHTHPHPQMASLVNPLSSISYLSQHILHYQQDGLKLTKLATK